MKKKKYHKEADERYFVHRYRVFPAYPSVHTREYNRGRNCR